jgi:hypothetical protein
MWALAPAPQGLKALYPRHLLSDLKVRPTRLSKTIYGDAQKIPASREAGYSKPLFARCAQIREQFRLGKFLLRAVG